MNSKFGFLDIEELNKEIILCVDNKSIVILLTLNIYIRNLIIELLPLIVRNYSENEIIEFIIDLQKHNEINFVIKIIELIPFNQSLTRLIFINLNNEILIDIVHNNEQLTMLINKYHRNDCYNTYRKIKLFDDNKLRALYTLTSTLRNSKHFQKRLELAIEGNKYVSNIEEYIYFFDYEISIVAFNIDGKEEFGKQATDRLLEYIKLPVLTRQLIVKKLGNYR